MRRALTLALLALAVWGCGEDEPAAQLHGEWLTEHGTTVSYDEDGNWSAQHPTYGSEPFDWMLYHQQ